MLLAGWLKPAWPATTATVDTDAKCNSLGALIRQNETSTTSSMAVHTMGTRLHGTTSALADGFLWLCLTMVPTRTFDWVNC
jgi:hypothetical protein